MILFSQLDVLGGTRAPRPPVSQSHQVPSAEPFIVLGTPSLSRISAVDVIDSDEARMRKQAAGFILADAPVTSSTSMAIDLPMAAGRIRPGHR